VTGGVPLPSEMPAVAARMGLEAHPVDVTDAAQRRWLQCLVWPEHTDRSARLARALDRAAATPPPLRQGTFPEDVPSAVEQLRRFEPTATVVVMHSAAAAYLDTDGRRRLGETLTDLGVHRLSLEGAEVSRDLGVQGIRETDHRRFVLGLDGRALGSADPHGRDLHWWACPHHRASPEISHRVCPRAGTVIRCEATVSTTEPIEPTATRGPVHVVGTGLLGTSVAMALTARHVPVTLTDVSPSALALARDLGAGTVAQPEDDEPALVVVAAPPDVTAELVAAQLRAHPGAVVTDVASVKEIILTELQQIAAQDQQVDLSRYVGSHPMAGRERSGAGAATADLFIGRPWVIAAHGASTSAAVLAIRSLAVDLGAPVATLTAAEPAAALAALSHLPHLMASLPAAQLAGAPDHALALAGQGLRDVTRIAASDPRLWSAILSGNGPAVTEVLHQVRAGLDDLITAMDAA